jgi:small subunit ribosomal protein S20
LKSEFVERGSMLAKGTRYMANTKSAKKAARQAERRTLINKSRRSRMRTFVRKVEEAIASGDRDAANVALREAQPEIMRSASKGLLHKNTASRKISRLSARIKTLAAVA